MKNVHILPTDKPSRLYLHSENELQLRTNIIRTSEDYLGSNQHIYITSDEEIKEGDYVYDSKDNVIRYVKKYLKDDWIKKIILTTDQDLIKDGVQAINNEFLEWFVKNPSCEEVEVNDWLDNAGCIAWGLSGRYQIIIPKEEVKKIYYNTVGRENGVNVVKGQFNTQKEALDLANELNRKYPDLYYDWRKTLIKEEPNPFELPKALPDDVFYESLEPKQETLEEAAETNSEKHHYAFGQQSEFYQLGFIEGAKWMQERMYSEKN